MDAGTNMTGCEIGAIPSTGKQYPLQYVFYFCSKDTDIHAS